MTLFNKEGSTSVSLTSITTKRKHKILVIDDEHDIRTTVKIMLAAEGYECLLAADAQEARNHRWQHDLDLVITDLKLGDNGGSGMDLIDEVMKVDDTIPVVLITGFPSIHIAVSAMKHGAAEFLTKPFERDQLLHAVHKALQERALRMENMRLKAEVNKAAVIEKLNRELNLRVNELTRLYTISEGMNKFMDTQSLLNKIIALAAEITGAERVSIMLLDRSRRFLNLRSAIGMSSDLIEQVQLPVGHGVAGYVVQTGRSIRMTQSEIHRDPAATNGSRQYKTNSWLSIPLTIDQEIFGVLNLTDKLDRSDFSREDEHVMHILSEKAGTKLENQALYEGIYSNLVDTLSSLVTSIEAKDPYTREHSVRVTEYAITMGRYLDIGDDQIEMLNFAGMLHDIGKIGVRDDVLTKPGRLTRKEFDAIKLHPIVGERIVEPLGLINQEKSIIRHHHERFDGSGYPDGLAGEDIPLLARIVAVVDAFDAMTTTRSYRKAMSLEHAVAEMKACAGKQFDPQIVENLFTAIEEGLIIPPATSPGDTEPLVS